MKGKRTHWTKAQLRSEIIGSMMCIDTSNEPYQPKDIVKDFEELCEKSTTNNSKKNKKTK